MTAEPEGRPMVPMELDYGIRRAVDILRAGGIETYESCEGGEGHAYPEPTVCFHGDPPAGWHAVALCLANGLPIAELRRVWHILDRHEPTGPKWAVTFRHRMEPGEPVNWKIEMVRGVKS